MLGERETGELRERERITRIKLEQDRKKIIVMHSREEVRETLRNRVSK